MFDWRRSSASLSRKPVSVIAGESTVTFPSWYALVFSPTLLLHPKQWAWQKSCFATGQLPPKGSPLFMLRGQLHLLLCFLECGMGTLFLSVPENRAQAEGGSRWFAAPCTVSWELDEDMANTQRKWADALVRRPYSVLKWRSQKCLAMICAAKTQPCRVSSRSLCVQSPLYDIWAWLGWMARAGIFPKREEHPLLKLKNKLC